MKNNEKLVLMAGLLVFASEDLDNFELFKKASTQVDYIGVNVKDKRLFVQFKNGGAYLYKDVDQITMQNAQRVPSIGTFIHESVKGKFEFEKANYGVRVATMVELQGAYEYLRSFRNKMVGQWVTNNPEAFNGHPNRDLLTNIS